MIDRRSVLGGLVLSGAFAGHAASAGAAFGFDDLVAHARALRDGPWRPVPEVDPSAVSGLDYDAYAATRHPLTRAAFPDSEFPVTFFPTGSAFRRPVGLNLLVDGRAVPVAYRADLFVGPGGRPASLPPGGGFAGFRLHDARTPEAVREAVDWAAFLGASYFRSDGDLHRYGVSGRGVAVDCAPEFPATAEEFPDFREFWIAPARDGGATVLALLDGPSLTGAYEFVLRCRPATTFDVRSRLFLRKDVGRLGIAPATSMYFYSETFRWHGDDHRPEVHDSDGLALWTGTGERIWRPLLDPPAVDVSAFGDTDPKGFGLMQRDREHSHYLDEVLYDRRPNLWVEPRGRWGKGSVQLVEIPTADEYHDNVVAFWVPERPARAGDDLAFDYRLHFSATDAGDPPAARCVATRVSRLVTTRGPGGQTVLPERFFVVEYAGPGLRAGALPTPDLWTSRGTVTDLGIWPPTDGGTGPVRVLFKLRAQGSEPVELRLALSDGGVLVGETWLFRLRPDHG